MPGYKETGKKNGHSDKQSLPVAKNKEGFVSALAMTTETEPKYPGNSAAPGASRMDSARLFPGGNPAADSRHEGLPVNRAVIWL